MVSEHAPLVLDAAGTALTARPAQTGKITTWYLPPQDTHNVVNMCLKILLRRSSSGSFGSGLPGPLPVPRPEGEDDEPYAHHHRENTDEWRQRGHIRAHQGCKDYAEEHR